MSEHDLFMAKVIFAGLVVVSIVLALLRAPNPTEWDEDEP